MTRRALVLAAGAERELEEATKWYDREGAGRGLELADEVGRVFEALVVTPNAGLPVAGVASDVPVRRRLIDRFPYAIVFVETEEAVHVIAIAHMKRRPNYWRSRLRRIVRAAPPKPR